MEFMTLKQIDLYLNRIGKAEDDRREKIQQVLLGILNHAAVYGDCSRFTKLVNSRAIKRGESTQYTNEARPIMLWIQQFATPVCTTEGATPGKFRVRMQPKERRKPEDIDWETAAKTFWLDLKPAKRTATHTLDSLAKRAANAAKTAHKEKLLAGDKTEIDQFLELIRDRVYAEFNIGVDEETIEAEAKASEELKQELTKKVSKKDLKPAQVVNQVAAKIAA